MKENTKTWFSGKCKSVRTKLSKNFSRDPFNKTIRDKFVNARIEYKKECREAEKGHKRCLTQK